MKNNFKIKSLISVFLLAFICNTFSQPYAIGTRTVTFQDSNRNNRNVETVFYYPATQAGSNQPFESGDFPLLVFGHGFMMNYDAYALYWQNLVPRGYIIALPRTEEGTGPNHGTFGQDLRFLINRIKWESANNSASFLYGHVGPTSALMGHSMGGGASFLGAAGNNNINALINFAAAETNPSAISAAASIKVPTLMFMGTHDGVTPPATHQLPMYNALASSCKTIVKINGGGHCYFAESNTACTTGEIFTSPQPTITRAAQHSVIMAFLIPYLDFVLKHDMASKVQFQDSLALSNRITFEQSCSDYDLGISEIVSPVSSCAMQSENVIVKIQNYGGQPIVPGLVSYNLNGSSNITESVSGTLNPGEFMSHTFASPIDVSAPGQYNLTATINHTNDTILTNNSLSTVLSNTSVFLPQAVDFTGFNGTNLSALSVGWQEAQGTTPAGTTSSWTSTTGLGSGNNTTAKVNFYSSPIREWIVSPAFKITPNTILSFDAAITAWNSFNAYASGMGTNDKLYIKFSSDCGLTWNNLDSIEQNTNLTNTLTGFSYNLSTYSGQILKIALQAFRASSVSNDYDFHIDNILIKDYPPIDLSPVTMHNPQTNVCYTASEAISIGIVNLGIDTLFLDNDNMTIYIDVVCPNGNQSFAAIVDTGFIIPGDTISYTVTNNLNINDGGIYNFNIQLALQSDGNPSNNSLSHSLYNSIPIVEITGDSVVCSGNTVDLNAIVIDPGSGELTAFSNNTSYSIPDNNVNGVTSQITVSNAMNITAADIISVKVNITHAFVSDLILMLTAPDNSFILLSNRRGGSTDNYNNVIFTMTALDSISNTQGPFSGPYIPEQPFTQLSGSANGTWRLNVSDNLSSDTGTLLGWEISLNTDNEIITYSWSTGTTGTQITVSPIQALAYQLTITDVLGCSSILDYSVNVLTGYNFSLGNDTSICQGQTATFDAGSFNTVVWHDQSTSQYYSTNNSEQVIAVVTNNCGNFSDTVNVNVLPLPLVNLGDTIGVCTNTPYTLDAGANFPSYLWSTQQTTQQIIISSAVETQELISVMITDNNGCSNSDTVLIVFSVCSGIYSFDKDQIILYPNPSTDYIIVNLGNDIRYRTSIYNLSGHLILENYFINTGFIDVSTLSSGIYILNINDEKSYFRNFKIIKQ